MANVSDSAILSAYSDVRDDKAPTNWVLLNYVDEKSDVLKVEGTGSGGLSEFVSKLQPQQASFGFLRVNVSNDALSQRAKFVLVNWCGSEVKVMRKAKLSVHIASVKNIFKAISIEISASDVADLSEEKVLLLLKKAMGANYDRQTTNY